MALISFLKYSAPKNKLERRICAALSVQDLDGDWLNYAPDLDAGERRCRHALETAPGPNDALKYSNPLTIVREKESVYIIRTGVLTDKKEKLCGFELVKSLKNINKMTDFKMVPLAEIKPDPNQPRKYYDETAMLELTDSIKEKGVLQPILLRPIGSSEAYLKIDPAAPVSTDTRRKVGYTGPVYILVCGERRYRASITAGLAEIPAVIRELSDEEALELQIIENLQRKDVHPLEEAVAFKSLAEKGKDIKEIAARVGKSPFYARQRMKLCDLSNEWQQVYYANRISAKLALTLCTFDEKIQKEIWKDRGGDNGGHIEFNDWYINKYRGELKNASFDLADTTLDKKAGACSSCQFNSAVASLFPEAAEKPMCSKSSCFTHKTDVHFDRALKQAKEEPEVIFVNTQYHSTEDNLVRQLQKEGHTLLNGYGQGHFEVIKRPDLPLLDDFDPEDFDSEAERQEAFQGELKDYEKELKEYETKVAGGKFKKAFSLFGDDKGKFVYIQIQKGSKANGSSKSTKEKEAAGKLTAQDVTDEIKRIQDREKRAKEIDINKNHRAILEALVNNKEIKKLGTAHQGKVDRSIMIYILLHEVSGGYILQKVRAAIKRIPAERPYGKVGYAFEYFKALGEVTDDELACIIRIIAHEKWGTVNMQGDVHAQDTPLRLIAEYIGIDIPAIEAEQAAVATTRQARVNKRIEELKGKQKELSKESKPAKKNAKKATTK
jgi:ParB family chromosome partitioning protein